MLSKPRRELTAAWGRLRARRGRSLLAALGIAAAAMMMGTAVTISYGLGTGFERATEQAHLPDLIARFQPADETDVHERIAGLANVEASSYRFERLDLGFFTRGDEQTRRTAVQVLDGGRRGYEIVDGRDVDGSPNEIVIDQGLAREWDLEPGDEMYVDTLGVQRIAGIALAPDDLAFPLASRARAWVAASWLPEFFTDGGNLINVVMLWARDPSQIDPLLVQARAASFGLENPRFVTEGGVRTLVSQAAGIVITLLIAFSLVALGTAVIALGAAARADVQRRLSAIGVMRAVGISRFGVASRYALDAALLAVPAAVLGLLAGALIAYGPSSRLLSILSEAPPGAALGPPLAAALTAIVGTVIAATVWPAWSAAGRPPAAVLRGVGISGSARRIRAPSGPFGLGLRLATARRARTLATAAVVAAAAAVVLLMLALASFLDDLQDDPGTIGKRYEISADLPASSVEDIERINGVEAAAARYETEALSSFRLGQNLTVIGYPGDHTRFEGPPLSEGRRIESPGEVEVGRGLAEALGLSPGATLATQLPSGKELRLKVVGVVSAIENDGRVAYVRERPLLDADPGLAPEIAVKLADGADQGAVTEALAGLGATPTNAAGATDRNQAFLGVLADVLRVVAAVNGLICLYILTQALAVTAIERRRAIAVLRSSGAGRRAITAVLLGAALAVVAIAVPAALAAEILLLGPLVAELAAGYAAPELGASPNEAIFVAVGLLLLAALAAWWVGRGSATEPIAPALRGSE